MNRLLTIIMLCFSITVTVSAQKGLHVSQVFDGQIVPKDQMVETIVRGKMLSKYQLSFFRSVRFKASDKQCSEVWELAVKDKQKGKDWNQKQKNGMTALMVQLPPQDGHNRYLCYRGQKQEVTLIYMEGSLTSIDKLKELLNY